MNVVKRKVAKSRIELRGVFKLKIVDHKTGRVAGDSGWTKNTCTRAGLNGIAAAILGTTGSSQAIMLLLATQSTSINSTHTIMAGQVEVVRSGTGLTKSTINYGTGQILCTFHGSDMQVTQTEEIGMIGIYADGNSTGGLLVAAQTFNTSGWYTDQDVNATYQLRFVNTT